MRRPSGLLATKLATAAWVPLVALAALVLFGMYRAEQARNAPASPMQVEVQPPDPYAGIASPPIPPERVYTDAEVGITSDADAQRQEAVEQLRKEQAELRRRYDIYECILRNSRRSSINDQLLMSACTEFPKLGSSWFGR